MQQIYIKNFGGITEATIDVAKIVVFIGEQASGKSTAARLIWFFTKTVRDEVVNPFIIKIFLKQADNQSFENTLKEEFKKNFYENIKIKEDFELRFDYEDSDFFYIQKKQDSITIQHSFKFIDKTIARSSSWVEKTISKGLEYAGTDFKDGITNSLIKKLESEISNNTNYLYHIAGRNAATGYSQSLESVLYGMLQSNKHKTYNEKILLQFIDRIFYMKNEFKKNGGSFASYIAKQQIFDKDLDIEKLNILQAKFKTILKGDYSIGDDEKIRVSENSSVYLSDASSGQQEAIRILQDIFLVVAESKPSFRIVEEPEAHLFPAAQRHLVELLALMANNNADSNLIITTHSPYIITVLNSLLFAHQIAKNDAVRAEMNEMIDPYYHINPDDFRAYSFGHFGNEQAEFCAEILNKETGLIQSNFLDVVSEMLNIQNDEIFALYRKTLKTPNL